MIKYAKEFKCNVQKCGRQAVVFVGLNDPDATEYPKCRKHADEWHWHVISELSNFRIRDHSKTNDRVAGRKRKHRIRD